MRPMCRYPGLGLAALVAALLVWYAALAPNPAVAQGAAPVRAVEHPEYSRLVIPLGAQSDFALSRKGARADIRLTGLAQALDIEAVFDRMPRTRILSVQALPVAEDGARVLRLTLGCSCSVTAEALGSGYLAVDVRRVVGEAAKMLEARTLDDPASENDGRDVTISGGERATAGGPPQMSPPKDATVPRWVTAGAIQKATRTLPQIDEALEAEAGLGAEPDATAKASETTTSTGESGMSTAPAAPEDPVLAARRALVQELSRAADEGILSLAPEAETELAPLDPEVADVADQSPNAPVAEMAAPRPESLDKPGAPSAPPQPPKLTAGLTPHLTIRGPSDSNPAQMKQAQEGEVVQCVADKALNVNSWALYEGNYFSRVGELRRTLVDKSGGIDPKSVANLSRHYIASGFGREASVLLRVMGDDVEDLHVLADIANLVEGGDAAPEGPIAASDGCIGRVSLWRAAGGMTAFDFETPEGQEIERSLLELPPVLRRLLGQSIARNALLNGAPGAARRIIGFLDRTPGQPTSLETEVRAELALTEGNPDEAIDLLAEALDRASPNPQAMSVYARAVLAGGRPLNDGLSVTLAAVAAPLPLDSGSGLDLRLLRARVDAADGFPLQAMERLRELLATQNAPTLAIIDAAREILIAFDPLGYPPDVATRVIMDNEEFLGQDRESATLRQAYARALLEAGLPAQALDVVAMENQLPTADMRLIAARAHLQLGAPEAALLSLAPVAGETAARLRAEAYVRKGDVVAGFEALEDLADDDPERHRLALLARRWDALASDDPDDTLARMASYARTEEMDDSGGQDVAPDKAGLLTRDLANEALEAARGLQTALEDLPSEQ